MKVERRAHFLTTTILLLLVVVSFNSSCDRATKPVAPQTPLSGIKAAVTAGGPLVLTSSTVEFQVLPSGYVQASLIKDGQKFTLDDLGQDQLVAGNSLVIGGKTTAFELDLVVTKFAEASGKMGRGRRAEIPAHVVDPSDNKLQATMVVEVYDDFPNLALTTVEYRNTSDNEIRIDQAISEEHRFSSHKAKAAYDMWSFQGSSSDWGKDDVIRLKPGFSQPNDMGAAVKGGYGGGIPVVAFWTDSVGEAIGHVETVPLTLSLPVSAGKDSSVKAAVIIPGNVTLKPGEKFSTPRTFIAVYSGDFYEPLGLWSSVLAKEGWNLPKPSSEAYNVSWCGWGYEFNVTPAQMLGTVPKLKEMGIKWATLDDRWFDTYGDWNPRSETFPGDSIKTMVDDFHKQGELVQLWWLPLGVEDGQGKWESHHYRDRFDVGGASRSRSQSNG
jgi:alpha-galactosidase